MASKKSYSRYFIILQEDENGYGLAPGKTPTGYAKIEIKNSKCKVSYYVQNLKPETNKYCMVLICGKKGSEKLLNIGSINLDDQGRSEISYEYDVNNIGGTNMSIDKVIGASIAKMVGSNVISLMSGFTTTDVPKDWRNYTLVGVNDKRDEGNIFETYEEKIEESKEEKDNAVFEHKETLNEKGQGKQKDTQEKQERENKENKKIEEKQQREDKENKDIEQKQEKQEREHKEEIEDIDEIDSENKNIVNEMDLEKNRGSKKDKDCKKEKKEIKKEIKEDVKEEIKEKVEDKIKDIKELKEKLEEKVEDKIEEEIEKKYKKSGCKPKGDKEEFFEALAKDFKKYCDIFPMIKKSTWYKVPVNDMEDICDMSDYDKYVILYYPMICYYPYIKNHEHYLVGYKYDDNCNIKYIMYAIPGDKAPKCQPFAGKTGFVTWMKTCNSKDSQGYWIMFYDFKTSSVLIPIKKKK